jgi:hypothetical protein
MDSSAAAPQPPLPVSQRELLGLIMGCAARRSATFSQAEFAVVAAGGGPDARALTRELLTDLTMRRWIELRLRLPSGDEAEIEWRHWELEFVAERNWEGPVANCACYAFTDKGRERLFRTHRR